MNAASRIKITHYATREAQKDEKTVPVLCGHKLPLKDTSQDPKEVNCFICFTKLNEK